VPGSLAPKRLTQALVLAATSLVAPAALADAGADAGDAGATVASANASDDAGDPHHVQIPNFPLYGAPPPEHSCRCDLVGGEPNEAGSFGVAGAVIAGLIVTSRRRRRPSR
jgi:hypothetical protein